MSEIDDILGISSQPGIKRPEEDVILEEASSEFDRILEGVPRLEESDPQGYGDVRLEAHEPTMLDRLFRQMKDPAKEGAKAVQALTDAAMMNELNRQNGIEGTITPSQAMRYRHVIDKDSALNPARAKLRGDTGTMVVEGLKTGFAQVNMGLWAFKALMGDDSPEVWDAIKKTQAAAIKPEEERPYPESTAAQFAVSTAEMTPFLAESMRRGGWRGMILAGGAAVMGAATGTSEIVYPLLPAMYAVGQSSASLEFVGKVEAGLAYVDLAEYEDPETGEKINPEVARAAAYGVGAINGLLEYAQLKTLVSTFPGGKKLLRGIINDTVKEVVESKALHQLMAGKVREYGGLVVKETTQELAQEGINIVADVFSRKLTNALDNTDLSGPEMKKIFDRLIEVAKTSAQAFAVMGLPGPAISAASVARQKKAADRFAQERQERTKKIIQASILDRVKQARDAQAEPALNVTEEEVREYIDNPEKSKITDEQLDAILNESVLSLDEAAFEEALDAYAVQEAERQYGRAAEDGKVAEKDEDLDIEGTEAGIDVPASIGEQEPVKTETPEFKAWFGDSKVVDEKGEPLVVYHGTHEAGIDSFVPNELGAIFLSTSKPTARSYGKEVMPLHVSMKNPLTVDAKGESFKEVIPSAYIEEAKRGGYDGVIVENIRDDASYHHLGDTIIAFEPTQIKSVFNQGTFDPNDPRITAAVGSVGKRNVEAEAFSEDAIKSVPLREATQSGLMSEDESAVIDGIRAIFPEAWNKYLDVRVSDQTFTPTPEQLKAHGIPGSQAGSNVVEGVLLTEKVGELKEEARNIIVLFSDSKVDTFLHEFGEFAYKRLLGPVQSRDMKTVSQEYKKAKDKFKKTKAGKNRKFMEKNEWFADGFRDWWLRQLNGESSIVSKELQGVFRRVLNAVKQIWQRLKKMGKRHPLDPLFEDIITNGRDLQEKYYYSQKEAVLRYIIGQDPDASDLKKQGFAKNGKTEMSWDPGTVCPKKRNLLEYVAKHLTDGNLGDLRNTDAHDAIWQELLNPDFWIRIYDQAVADGVDVPCSYCYVEQARKVAVHEFNKGKNISEVIAAKAKPVYETTPYRGAILKWTQKKIDDLNARGGLRLFSFSDYVRDWHHDNVKLLLDHAKQRGLSVKAITKNPEFVEDFADRGITINVSIDDGVLGQNGGLAWDLAHDLKSQNPNVKVRTVAMNLEEYKNYATLTWKGMTNFIDVITPYHHSDYTKPMPAGASDFKFRLKDGKLEGGNKDSQALIDWIEENPRFAGEERTCCLVGGKCFKPEHQKQCASNCGAFAGNLTIPASIGEAPKTTIRRETGQSRTKEEYQARNDLKDAIKMAVRNARIAFRQGKKEGVEQGKATIRAIVAKSKDAQKVRNEATKVRGKIEKALKKTKVKKKGGKPQGKYGAETQRILDTLRNALKLKNQREAAERLQANLEKYTEEYPPDAVVWENRILDMASTPVMGITEDQIARWEGLLKDIEAFKAGGEFERERVRQNRLAMMAFVNQEVRELLGGIPEGIEAVGEEAVTDDSLKAKVKRSLIAGEGITSVVGWKDLLDILSFYDKDSAPGESLISTFGDVLDQKNAEKEGNMLAMEELRQMVFDSFNIKTDNQMVKKMQQDAVMQYLGTYKTLNGKMVDLRMTRAQARKRAMELTDPTLHDTFFTREGMGWTNEFVDAIRDFLTAEDEAFIAAQLEWYQKYYQSVNDVYSEMYGVDLPSNPNYSPLSREGVNKADELGPEFLKEIPFRASATSAGSLKSRTANVYPLALANDVEVLMRHVSEMEHFRAWAYKIRDLNAVFSNPDTRQAIKINFGKKVDREIQRFIQDFARGGAETAKNLIWVDKLRSNYTRGVLAVKPTILIKQLTSTVAFADSMPVKDFARLIPKTPGQYKEAARVLMDGSTMMQHRLKSGEIERDIKTMMNSSEFAKLRTSPSFWNALTLNVKIGDAGAIIWGGYPVYKYNYDRMIASGMDAVEAHKRAIKIFEGIAETTQQSPDISEQSFIQRSNSFAKLFTMFMSSTNQYLRKEIGAVRNLAAGRISKAQAAKTIAIYHFVLPMLFQWVSDRFTWDPEEQSRAMILGSLNGYFIAGDALEAIIRAALGLQRFDLGNPLYSIVKDMEKAVKLVDWDNLDTEGFLMALRGLSGAVGSFAGIPAKQAVDIGTGFSDVLSGEYEKGIAELMGWSPYQAKKAAEED
jgi:hypothetical protein